MNSGDYWNNVKYPTVVVRIRFLAKRGIGLLWSKGNPSLWLLVCVSSSYFFVLSWNFRLLSQAHKVFKKLKKMRLDLKRLIGAFPCKKADESCCNTFDIFSSPRIEVLPGYHCCNGAISNSRPTHRSITSPTAQVDNCKAQASLLTCEIKIMSHGKFGTNVTCVSLNPCSSPRETRGERFIN